MLQLLPSLCWAPGLVPTTTAGKHYDRAISTDIKEVEKLRNVIPKRRIAERSLNENLQTVSFAFHLLTNGPGTCSALPVNKERVTLVPSSYIEIYGSPYQNRKHPLDSYYFFNAFWLIKHWLVFKGGLLVLGIKPSTYWKVSPLWLSYIPHLRPDALFIVYILWKWAWILIRIRLHSILIIYCKKSVYPFKMITL